MKWKLVVALLAAFGPPVLLATTMAQDEPRPGRSSPAPGGTYVIRGGEAQTLQAIPVPPAPPTPTPLHGVDRAYMLRFVNNPEEANLERRAEELGRKLSAAGGSEDRSKIKDQLTEVLGKQFDLRQKRHQDEIKALEDKIKKLRDLVDKRQENRKEIIAKRLDQIQSDAEGLGW